MADGNWFKCTSCGLVLQGHGPRCAACEAEPRPRAPRRARDPQQKASNLEAVRAHRERTGNAYMKAYNTAKNQAVKRLIAAHGEEFARFMEEERRAAGLGPAR